MASLSYNTLGELNGTHRVFIYCQAPGPTGWGCRNSAELNLPKLIERFGPDYDIVQNRSAFLQSFRCTKCGKKDFTLSTVPLDTPSIAGSGAYTLAP